MLFTTKQNAINGTIAITKEFDTILHDMAQNGNIEKAELLLKYGAKINSVDQEYQSTPLGMSVRWGHVEMVNYLRH